MQLISPILAKDLWPLLRSRRAYWLMFALLTGAGGMLCLMSLDLSRHTTQSLRSQVGRTLFLMVSLVQLCCLGLFAPALTASSITVEREMKTFDLLEATTLSRFDILWNKWRAAISFLLLAAVLLLPIQTMVFQFGGVGRDEYFTAGALLLAAILTYGMLGLAVSSRLRNSTAALAITMGIVLVQNAGLFFSLLMLAELNWIPLSEREVVDSGKFYSIFVAYVEVIESRMPGKNAFSHALGVLILHAALFVIYAWIAWRNLRRVESTKVSVARKLIHDPTVLELRRKKFPYYIIDPLARAQHIADGKDPVLVREQRTGVLSRPVVLIRVCYVAVFFSLFYGLQDVVLNPAVAPMRFSAILLGIGVLAIPALAALAVSKELESGTLDLLLTTPVQPMQIIMAKFRATLRFMTFICVSFLILPFFFYIVYFGLNADSRIAYLFYSIGLIVPYLAAFFSLFAAIGIYASCISRRTSAAMITTYLVILALALLPFIIENLCMTARRADFLMFHDRSDLWFISALGRSISPFYYFSRTFWPSGRYGSTPPGAIWTLAINAAGTLALSWFILRRAAAKLARRAFS